MSKRIKRRYNIDFLKFYLKNMVHVFVDDEKRTIILDLHEGAVFVSNAEIDYMESYRYLTSDSFAKVSFKDLHMSNYQNVTELYVSRIRTSWSDEFQAITNSYGKDDGEWTTYKSRFWR